MDVSIIIVNWNSIDYLRECIVSIYRHTKLSFEIIVVDNASPCGDAALLEQECLPITLIKSKENLGFAGANNLGFKHSSGKYILFLNPDTRLVSPAIDLMVQALGTMQDAGIIGCTLLNENLSIQTSCIQTFPTILNQCLDSDWLRQRWPHSRLWGTGQLFSDSGKPASVEMISGACMLVRRDIFEQVGLFSEEYFMYAEDLDLCYKIEKQGYLNYFLSTATVIHYGGKSSSVEWATEMKWKSIVRFCEKHRGRLYALAFRLAITFAGIARLMVITGEGLSRSTIATPQSRRSALIKWKLIIRAMLTLSHRPSSCRIA